MRSDCVSRVEADPDDADNIIRYGRRTAYTGDYSQFEAVRAVADAIPIPVIASGGVGNLEHIREGLVAESARWGDAIRSDRHPPYKPDVDWQRLQIAQDTAAVLLVSRRDGQQ